LNDLDVVSIAEGSGDYMLIASLLDGVKGVFDEDVEMATVENYLFLSQVEVCDDAGTNRSHMLTSLHRVQAEGFYNVAELSDSAVNIVKLPCNLASTWMAGSFKFIS